MQFKLKKPLRLLAGFLAFLSVIILIIEGDFTVLVFVLNMMAIALFFYDAKKSK